MAGVYNTFISPENGYQFWTKAQIGYNLEDTGEEQYKLVKQLDVDDPEYICQVMLGFTCVDHTTMSRKPTDPAPLNMDNEKQAADVFYKDCYPQEHFPNVFLNKEEGKIMAELQPQLKSYVDQTLAKWITSGVVEEEWEGKMEGKGNGYWLNQPAKDWELTIPIGNGRLGASVWGDIEKEQVTINEESMWYGSDKSRRNHQSGHYFHEIRELLLKGAVEEAQFLCQMAMTGMPKYIRPYQMACDLRFLFFHEPKSAEAQERTVNYRRELDMDQAVTRVAYELDGTLYEREFFVSARYQVLVMRFTAKGQARMKFQFNINRRPFEEISGGDGKQHIFLRGKCGDGVEYYSGAMIGEQDGHVMQVGDYLGLQKASDVVVYFDCETSFAGKNPEETCMKRLRRAAQAGYEAVRQAHIEDYRRLYSRMSLALEENSFRDIALNELRKRTEETKVRRYLTQLVFAFGRYLLIASSSSCELPANLQGIWCGSYVPRWESKYTININTEMNYWMADSCGLSECFEPYVKLVKKMVEKGRDTAASVYQCRGSVGHHNTDCYGNTDIEGLPASAYMWPMGLVWMSLGLFDHYRCTLDKEYLKETVMPILEENILFFYDYLYRDESGEWLTGPSVSPENTYLTGDGQSASITMAPAMDNELLWELCQDYLEGIKDLEEERQPKEEGQYSQTGRMAQEILEHLPPISLTADGRIREWREDYQEKEKGHRHLSHLFALYPGHQISRDTPKLLEAVRKTLRVRLENAQGHIGWSRAWLICLYARLWDSKEVGEGIRKFLEDSLMDNLYDSHPPFQIDGNFGICAGIVEAIAQSDGENVYLLPAIPKEWESGCVKGLRRPKGLILDLCWEKDQVKFSLISLKKQQVEVYCRGQQKTVMLEKGQTCEGRF